MGIVRVQRATAWGNFFPSADVIVQLTRDEAEDVAQALAYATDGHFFPSGLQLFNELDDLIMEIDGK